MVGTNPSGCAPTGKFVGFGDIFVPDGAETAGVDVEDGVPLDVETAEVELEVAAEPGTTVFLVTRCVPTDQHWLWPEGGVSAARLVSVRDPRTQSPTDYRSGIRDR
ncbi:MAG: hypothetical protein ACR2M5_06810 [Nakamurella sp.]